MRRPTIARDLLQDLRYAVRLLIKQPGFTAVTVLSVALGIGANAAVFSFADAILSRPLDVPRPRDVVRVTTTTPVQRFSDLSFREFETFRDRNTTLDGLTAEWRIEIGIRLDEREAARVTYGALVSHNYFRTLGVEPTLGRSFLAEEDSPAARDLVAVVSHRAWQMRFNADPAIVGRRVTLNGQPVTVIGVAPASFPGTDIYVRQELYLPLAAAPRLRSGARILDDPNARVLLVRGRLKAGVTVDTAAAEFQSIATALTSMYPDTNRQRGVTVLRDLDQRLETKPHDTRLTRMLHGTVLLVLLIAAANVANLLVGRGVARGKEVAIRMSVGASRLRVIRQLLTESLLLAAIGGAAGLVLTQWAIAWLRALPLPTDYPIVIDVRMDHRVVLFGLGLALVTGVVFGLAPALHATRAGLIAPVKGGASSRRPFRGRYVLVAAQAALSVVLLVCAGLFVKSFANAAAANPGFRVDNVLLASFVPSLVDMSAPQLETFYEQLQARVRALPRVESVTMARQVHVYTDSFARRISIDGYRYPTERAWDRINVNYVDVDFFDTMATPIVEGRALDDRDRQGAPRVAVVNETMAAHFWPNRSAVGQRFALFAEGRDQGEKVSVEVVGVARNAKYFNILEPKLWYFYLPYRQHPQQTMTLHVRTAGDPLTIVPALRREAQALAPDLPMFDVHTMRDVFENKGLLAARLIAQMVGVMGLIGVTLALVGLYAVMAFVVTHRTREIGIRIALGQTRASVVRMTLRSALIVAAAGVVIGLTMAFGVTRYFSNMLEGISPRDPVVFGVVTLALATAATAAAWIPARRAASIDPALTLRQE